MENRFKQLRYTDKFLLHQEISMTKLAEKMEISKATISKLESSDDYDARISIIRKYKEQFPEVSYDFLMGGIGTKEKPSNHIEEALPFSDEFYKHLEELFFFQSDPLLSEDELRELHDYDSAMHRCIEMMLESFVSNPRRFSFYMISMYQSLYKIYELHHPDNLTSTLLRDEEENLAWFNITQNTISILKDVVYPKLQSIFEEDHINAQKKLDKSPKSDKDTTISAPLYDDGGLPFF